MHCDLISGGFRSQGNVRYFTTESTQTKIIIDNVYSMLVALTHTGGGEIYLLVCYTCVCYLLCG